ncbi:hypothetical protein BDZ97DRAFT_1767423 [Flammula alnicola]|nr:hypothetical protein BDZ97DRAFT_1767423 [Flammula alnicola]
MSAEPPEQLVAERVAGLSPSKARPAVSKTRAVTITNKKLRPKSPEVIDIPDSEEDDEEEEYQDDEEEEDLDDEGELNSEEELGDEVDLYEEDSEHDMEADATLVGGDTLYPEPSVPTRVKTTKRPAPVTPPLATRNRKNFSKRDESPTKKKKVAPPSPPDDERISVPSPKTPTKKRGTKEKGGKERVGTGAPLSSPFVHTPSRVLDALDALEVSDSKQSAAAYLEDTDITTVSSLPDSCYVSHHLHQDPEYKKKGYYDNLPNLKHAVYKKDMTHVVATTVRFVRDGRYINPSRVDPTTISARSMPSSGGFRHELCLGGKNLRDTAICVTPVMVMDSFVAQVNSLLNFSGHYITGIFHTEEWQRFAGVVGMITHHSRLYAHIWSDAITFGTLGASFSERSGTSGAGSSHMPASMPVGMFNTAASPSKKPAASGQTGRLDYTAKGFDNLKTTYPLYESEIPRGSLAVVGYITQTWGFELGSGADTPMGTAEASRTPTHEDIYPSSYGFVVMGYHELPQGASDDVDDAPHILSDGSIEVTKTVDIAIGDQPASFCGVNGGWSGGALSLVRAAWALLADTEGRSRRLRSGVAGVPNCGWWLTTKISDPRRR